MPTTSTLQNSISLSVPPGTAWKILAHDFDKIGEWASAVPVSQAVAKTDSCKFSDAPMEGRTCHLQGGMQIREDFVAYSAEGMTYTYAAHGGPFFVSRAHNTWTVVPSPSQPASCTVTCRAEMELSGVVGWVAKPAVEWYVGGTLRGMLEELKAYVERGEVGEAKRRQIAGTGRK